MLIHDYVYWATGEESLAQAALSASSIRRLQPQARFHLYTDMPDDQGWAQHVVEFDIKRYPLMVANLVILAQHALSDAFYRPTAFIDTDILLVKPLEISRDIDLAVTRRDYESIKEDGTKNVGVARSMPYNFGVILANPSVTAIEALLWLRDRVSRLAPHHQGWFGNQVALRELIGYDPDKTPPYRITRLLPWAEVKIEVLSCEEWNYTPETLDEDISTRRVLHFKGGRKDMIEPYLQRLQGTA